MSWVRALRRALAGRRPAGSPFLRQRRELQRLRTLVRVFYACLLYFAVSFLYDGWRSELVGAADGSLLWPVLWADSVTLPAAANAVMALFLGGALCAVAFPGSRWARAAACLGMLEFFALQASYGPRGASGFTVWMLTACVFVLLPGRPPMSGPGARRGRQALLNVFFLAQVVVLSTYTMAGLSKLLAAAIQAARHQVHFLSWDGLPFLVARNFYESGQATALGAFIVENPLAGWLGALAVVAVESASVFAAFRPEVHRAWGAALILFHLGTFAVLGPLFPQAVLLLALLFLASPFHPD